jgi:transcriptional regulator with XRE-family HTH domain
LSVEGVELLRSLDLPSDRIEVIDAAGDSHSRIAKYLSGWLRPDATYALLRLLPPTTDRVAALLIRATLRAASPYSAQRLAAECGTTVQTLNRWMCAERLPSVGRTIDVLQVAHLLSVSHRYAMPITEVGKILGYRSGRAAAQKIPSVLRVGIRTVHQGGGEASVLAWLEQVLRGEQVAYRDFIDPQSNGGVTKHTVAPPTKCSDLRPQVLPKERHRPRPRLLRRI